MASDGIYRYAECVHLTNPGLVRSNNEDSFLCLGEDGLYCVADGMGGGEAGEIASAMVIECLNDVCLGTAEDSPGNRKYAVQQGLHRANGEVIKFMEDNVLHAMGSTVVILQLDPWDASHALICHVGDSRAFCFRNGELFCLTVDHNMGEEAKRKDNGKRNGKKMMPEAIAKALTRVIGGHTLVVPEWNDISVCPNDIFLLCSDGVSPIVSDEDICSILAEHSELSEALSALERKVLANGAPDNFTAVCVKIASELPAPPEIEDWEREESDLLLKVAEERKDYGAN